MDAEGSTIIVGFQDGVLRSFKLLYKGNQSNSKDTAFELVLFEAFKPHTKSITSIAIDAKSELIATGVRKCSLFLFYLENFKFQIFF